MENKVIDISLNSHFLRSKSSTQLDHLLLAELLLMHALHVPRYVHLLLGPVDAVGALKLRLLAALPLLMVPQAALQLVDAAAGGAAEAFAGSETMAWWFEAHEALGRERHARAPHDGRHVLGQLLPGFGPLQSRHYAQILGCNRTVVEGGYIGVSARAAGATVGRFIYEASRSKGFVGCREIDSEIAMSFLFFASEPFVSEFEKSQAAGQAL